MNINNYKRILKYVFQSAPWYLPIKLLDEVLQFLFYFIGILFTKYMTNCLIQNTITFQELVWNYALYFTIGFITWIFQYWTMEFFENFQKNRINKYIKRLIYTKVVDLDFFYFENTEFFDQYNRIITQIQDQVLQSIQIILSVIMSVLKIFTIIGLFMTMNLFFVIAAILLCIQTVITTHWFEIFFYQAYLEETPYKRTANYIIFIYQTINFVKELKIYQFYTLLNRYYEEALNNIIKLKQLRVKKLIKLLCSTNLFGEIVKLSVNIYIIIQINNKNLSVGDFLVIFTTITYLGNILSDFFSLYPKILAQYKYIQDLLEYLDYKPQIQKNESGKQIGVDENININIIQVDFAYPNRPDVLVLKNITMDIPFGSKIAIIGENGSGKTTLIKLILYLYLQSKGKIYFNKLEYNEYKTEELRACFGILFQDFKLFEISIAENILLKPITSDEEALVWEALEFVGLEEKVRSYANGIYTELSMEFSEDGIYLSGGEQQKLAIARAYAKKAKVLILDEPSSSLDPISEKEIFQKLMKLGKDKTVIYISHRLSTTIDADRIFVLDNGEIIEEGNHVELMEQRGKYYDMFQLQSQAYVS